MHGQQCVHRHVTERVAAFLSVPQQACARRASKALWEAVRAASMEDMLRAAVLEHRDASAVDAQLVVVAMSRVVGPFPSVDALLAWSGGLALLYDELQLRFPHAAAIGVSARLAAIRPFPFASGFTAMTVCVVTAVASAPSSFVLESVVLGVCNAAKVPVRALSHDGLPCPILCLEGATPEQFPNIVHDVLLSSLPSIHRVEMYALQQSSLRFVCLANLPLLESIGDFAFGECAHLSCVDLSSLPSLRRIEANAFWKCACLQSISLVNLLFLDCICRGAFALCVRLCRADLSNLPSLRSIGARAFWKCESLQSINLVNLPLLESIDERAFTECAHLSSVKFPCLPSLRRIKESVFCKCVSLRSISFANLPLLESIGDGVFAECACLSAVDLSSLPSLRRIGRSAFFKCESLRSVILAPLLESIGDYAFLGCTHLSTEDFSRVQSFREVAVQAPDLYPPTEKK